MSINKSLRAAAVAAALVAGINGAAAQNYPTKPVHIICGFSAGSTADISARVVAAKMSDILGQQFVVENRLGAGSSIAAASVATAPKDGYTLYVGSGANLINAAMKPNLSFDFVKDFAPVTLLTSTPTVLVVTPATGVKSVKELIAKAKARPNEILFGSSGVGSSTHMALELFNYLADVKITHVPYGGSPPVVTDLLGGRLNGGFLAASSATAHIKDGKLIALAVTDAKRSAAFPELPTMIEAGVPNFESVLWFGFVAPAGTPQPIIDKLSQAANAALKSAEVQKSLRAQMVTTFGGTPDEFHTYIAAEAKRWDAVVASAGLKEKAKK
jgi:tripartite-type tricarboxylate transporter receptor subunit TctC